MRHKQAHNENVMSLLDVPQSVLPHGAARDYLLEQAAAGEDVYAYSPIQLEERPELRRWNVWLRGSRWDLAVWLARFYQGRTSQA